MHEKSLKKCNYCKTFPAPIPTKAETEIYMNLYDLNNVVLTQYAIFQTT
jgi:hypothetical protein